MASIEVDDHQILAALHRLQRLAGDLRPALAEMGEDLVESTKHRFETSTRPDGVHWSENSWVTVTNKGEGKPPLTGETGVLMDTIDYSATADLLEVGSPMEYAAMQQFGGTTDEFPHLWGDIPARPFLGLSDDDRSDLLAIMQRHIEDAWR